MARIIFKSERTMQSSNTIPEHLKQFQIELAPLIRKIRETLSLSPNCNGQKLDNIGQVHMLMNDTHMSQLVASINVLATNVIAESLVTPETMINSMEDLRYALPILQDTLNFATGVFPMVTKKVMD